MDFKVNLRFNKGVINYFSCGGDLPSFCYGRQVGFPSLINHFRAGDGTRTRDIQLGKLRSGVKLLLSLDFYFVRNKYATKIHRNK